MPIRSLTAKRNRLWRARTVRRVREILRRPDARALDICCGTADLLLALERAAGRSGAACFGSHFCHPMLVTAQAKFARRAARAMLFESDALHLPVRDASLDLITVAFAFRNLTNYEAGLVEMRPGGMAAILEFSQPPNHVFRALYEFYSPHILPMIGGILTRNRAAYQYLPESVRKFPDGTELAADMQRAGFRNVSSEYLTGGIAALHVGTA
jgi:demethylmenaquinone methyltransferase/2-methoxy-6-polyprenyl-1,4-benzoquinol methylase